MTTAAPQGEEAYPDHLILPFDTETEVRYTPVDAEEPGKTLHRNAILNCHK